MKKKLCLFASIVVIFLTVLFIIPSMVIKDHTKTEKANFELEYIKSLLEEYFNKNSKYASSLSELLTWLKKNNPAFLNSSRKKFLDPWNVPYKYRYPGIKNKESYDLWTFGSDSVFGGTGDGSDITNWQ